MTYCYTLLLKTVSDNPFMHGSRNDLSFTIGLSDDYEGGQLELGDLNIKTQVKLKKGQIVIYPSGIEHQVLPVSKGTRIVIAGWIQTGISNQMDRDCLNKLNELKKDLINKGITDSSVYVKLSQIRTYLERKFTN